MPSIAWDEYDNAKPGVGPADAEGISNGYDHEKPPDDNPTSHFAESDNGVAVYVPDGPDGPAANANVTPAAAAAATGAITRDPAETVVVVAAVVVVDPNGATVVVVENTVVETGVVVEIVDPDRATLVVEDVVVEGVGAVEGVAGTVVVEEGAIPPGGMADEGAAVFVLAAAGTTSRARISPLTMSFVNPGTTTGATSQRDTDGANEQSPSWTSCNRSSQCPPNELRSDR